MEQASSWESGFLNWFGQDPNFYIVDRQQVEKILKELEFGVSGIVSPEARNELGKVLGVTHLFVLSFSRFNNYDTQSRRLIEVETGRVISSVSIDIKR